MTRLELSLIGSVISTIFLLVILWLFDQFGSTESLPSKFDPLAMIPVFVVAIMAVITLVLTFKVMKRRAFRAVVGDEKYQEVYGDIINWTKPGASIGPARGIGLNACLSLAAMFRRKQMYKTLLWLFAKTVKILIWCAMALAFLTITLTTVNQDRDLPLFLEFWLYPFSPLTAWGHEVLEWSHNNLALTVAIAMAVALGLWQLSLLMDKIQSFCGFEKADKQVDPLAGLTDTTNCTCGRSIVKEA